MGKGIDIAKAIDPDNAEILTALENMKDQLLIVLIKRLGGKARISVNEIDSTDSVMIMHLKEGVFNFSVVRKQ